MSESVDSIKQVIQELLEWAQDNIERESVHLRMKNMAERLEPVKDELIDLHGLTSALPLDLGNIHDLPAELLAELNVTKTDELDNQLITVINSYGGEANLDQILVGLYRKFKVSQKRRVIQNKLYRMEMIWSVDGKKGVYTTDKPTTEEASGEIADEIPF